MRAKERNAFRREIEQAEFERLERLERLEQQCEADESSREEAHLRSLANEVLSYFAMEQHVERFLACADGLALLANALNFAAKRFDCDLYEHKPYLIRLAASKAPDNAAWQDCGIVYIETALGQVSFHVFEDEDEGLPEADGREWSGIPYQFYAGMILQAWIENWSKEALQQRIAERERAVA